MADATGQFVIDFSPASRISHPETSRIAEQKITQSGKRASHCQIILQCLRLHNGSTTAELAQFIPLTEEQVHKRMNDLVENEDVRRGIQINCSVKGTQCCPWWVK